ncbi:MAG: hypothetical protein KJZ86_11655 [Caldilineaceae bacterium]|nr:hypothetical protein [Caldilineaceae bacterium]
MSRDISELSQFLYSYANSHPRCIKAEISDATVRNFSLIKMRSVYYCPEFAVRFSSAKGKSFSNGVLSLSALQNYDQSPFVVCIVRPEGIELLLANTTFLKKISHSSQQLRVDNVRGTFLGHDILREYDGIANRPENFAELFAIHTQFSWEENLIRLVKRTNAIVSTGSRFEPTEEQKANILQAPELANLLSNHPEYLQLGKDLNQAVDENLEAILDAAGIDNVNLRGNQIEQIITGADNLHLLEDVSRTLTIGNEVKVDIKTKILTLVSNPKGYTIDKVLETLASGGTVFSFFFVGINVDSGYVVTCLVFILDETILNATRVHFHWAGRNSRGVTQLTGDLKRVFEPDFLESVNVDQAKEFLQKLIELKPIPSDS